MEQINCLHFTGFSNCVHPDKGWLIFNKGCILCGDGFANGCKNQTATQAPIPRPELLYEEHDGLRWALGEVSDIPDFPPMPQVKKPAKEHGMGYAMTNNDLSTAILEACGMVEGEEDSIRKDIEPYSSMLSQLKILLAIQERRAAQVFYNTKLGVPWGKKGKEECT